MTRGGQEGGSEEGTVRALQRDRVPPGRGGLYTLETGQW